MVVSTIDFNVILGIYWLAENRASIDCPKKEVKFSPPAGSTFIFIGTSTGITSKVVSMMKAKRLVSTRRMDDISMCSRRKRKRKDPRKRANSK